MTRFLLLSHNCGFVDMGRPLWREDGSVFYNVQYTIYFTVPDLRAGPCIYIPQEQGGPVIPPGTGCTYTHTHTHTHTPVTLLSSVLTVCLTTLLHSHSHTLSSTHLNSAWSVEGYSLRTDRIETTLRTRIVAIPTLLEKLVYLSVS
jgi:hypothetical protein